MMAQNGQVPTVRKRQPAWSRADDKKLYNLVHEAGGDSCVDWNQVADLMGNRTLKQCREKYRNDLRLHITKGSWSLEEEYVLVLAHTNLGNKWRDIEAYLPHRAENSIKNQWNLVLRTKSDKRRQTFLWVYAIEAVLIQKQKQLGDLQKKALRQAIFEKACDKWKGMAKNRRLLPLSAFAVDWDHFTCGQMANEATALQLTEMSSDTVHSASARHLMLSRRAAGGSQIHTSRTDQDSACTGLPGMMGVSMPMPVMSLDLLGLPGMPPVPVMAQLHSSETGTPLPFRHPASSRLRSREAASIQGAAQQPPTQANMAMFSGEQLPGLPSMAGLSSSTRFSMSGPGTFWPFLAGRAEPIDMGHSANGLQYAPGMGMDGSGWGGAGVEAAGMGMDGSGWGGAGVGAAGMGMGAMGWASDLGDACCHVFQLGGQRNRSMVVPGTSMDHLEGHHPGFNHPAGSLLGGMGELNSMAGMAAKPAIPPTMLPLGRTSSSGAKHLPMALTFQPGNLPTRIGCGSAPLPIARVHAGRTVPAAVTPFAAVTREPARSPAGGGGYFSHRQPPSQGSGVTSPRDESGMLQFSEGGSPDNEGVDVLIDEMELDEAQF